jgi:hypothetical protein
MKRRPTQDGFSGEMKQPLLTTLMALASLTIANVAHAEGFGPDIGLNESVQSETYVGHVGQLDAIFYLKWFPTSAGRGGEISGTYFYPKRSNRSYDLMGNNFQEGQVYLEESTDGELTARIRLTKYIIANKIVWSGIMQNTDGRRFEISFQRDQ